MLTVVQAGLTTQLGLAAAAGVLVRVLVLVATGAMRVPRLPAAAAALEAITQVGKPVVLLRPQKRLAFIPFCKSGLLRLKLASLSWGVRLVVPPLPKLLFIPTSLRWKMGPTFFQMAAQVFQFLNLLEA